MPTVYNHTTAPAKKTAFAKAVRMFPLASFAEHPTNVHFETQEKEETVELFLRQHPIVNLPWIIIALLLFIAPSIIFPVILNTIHLTVPVGHIIVIGAFWYLATFGFVLTSFLSWYFDIYIVTNEHIVDIDFQSLLYKHFTEAELRKIQDISFTSCGIGATIFNYGNVVVETAGEMPSIDFEMVPKPQIAVERIRSLKERIDDMRKDSL